MSISSLWSVIHVFDVVFNQHPNINWFIIKNSDHNVSSLQNKLGLVGSRPWSLDNEWCPSSRNMVQTFVTQSQHLSLSNYPLEPRVTNFFLQSLPHALTQSNTYHLLNITPRRSLKMNGRANSSRTKVNVLTSHIGRAIFELMVSDISVEF